MKYFMVLALCLSAVVAEELHDRGVDFHTLHYSQHHQTVEEAKRNIAGALSGQHAEFDEVGSYGGLGGVGVGTVGFSTSGLASGGFGSGSGSSAEYSSSSGSNNFASSSSYGSNANFASNAYGSSGQHVGGSGLTSYLESSAARNVQQVVPEIVVGGALGGHDSYVHHEQHRVANSVPALMYSSPSGGSEKYYHHEERRTSNAANPVVYSLPSSGGSENYIHHEERRVQNQAIPVIQYSAPSGSSEKYVHIKEESVQQNPIPLVITSPSGGQESYMKYRKVTSTASQPQILYTSPSTSSTYHHHSSVGSTSGSQSGSLLTGGLIGANSNYRTANTGYAFPSTTFGSTGFDATHQANSNSGFGHQAGYGFNSAYTDSSSFGSKFNSESKFDSKFGTAAGSSSLLGVSGSSSGLNNYIQEAERLAKIQAQGLAVGGTRTGGSQFNTNLESGKSSVGIGGAGSVQGVGGGNSGYQTKSWEKASKWSSQSEFGSDGHVNNYKELSTGESENYDVNGHRTGYKAATATFDDNGKVSSYSLHT